MNGDVEEIVPEEQLSKQASDTRKKAEWKFLKVQCTHTQIHLHTHMHTIAYIHAYIYVCVFVGKSKMTKASFVMTDAASVYSREWPLWVHINICTLMRTFGHIYIHIFIYSYNIYKYICVCVNFRCTLVCIGPIGISLLSFVARLLLLRLPYIFVCQIYLVCIVWKYSQCSWRFCVLFEVKNSNKEMNKE